MLKRYDAPRRIAFAVVVLYACLLLLVVITGAVAADERPVVGRLTFDATALPHQQYDVGQFHILWEPHDGGRLSISHTDQPDFDAWSTVAGHSFISAGAGDALITQRRGYFHVQENLLVRCPDQTIDRLDVNDDTVVVTGDLACENGERAGYRLTFAPEGPRQLAFSLDVSGRADGRELNRSYLTYASERDEHIFGFGEQFSAFDLKGRRLPVFINEQGIGRGAQPLTLVANLQFGVGGAWYCSYAAVPHYITSRLRSLFLESSEYAVFDMRYPDRIQIQLFSPQMAGRIVSGDSPQDLISEYTTYAGRMRPLPDWVHDGAILSLQGGTERVQSILAEVLQQGVPVTGVWLQDWVGQRTTSFGEQLWWNWELDEQRYPEWDQLRADLAAQDIRLLGYVNPFVVDVSTKPNAERHLFQEAAELGYLVKDAGGGPYLIENSDFSAGLVDLTNPAASAWMRDVIADELIAIGMSGWMADFGEGLPFDAALASGETAASYHNQYPEAWARVNREALDASVDAGDLFFFMRSGYRQSPGQSTAFWLGDQLVSWDAHDGIKTAVVGLLSSGLSGFSLNHSDIGGYTSVSHPVLGRHRDEELLMRWMELNAFTVLYRTHESNRPAENIQVYSTPETLAQFDRFARVYRAWAFYRKQLVQEAAETGMPVVRHLFIHYPDDPNVYELSHQQFMVGDQFIVAPVLDKGAQKVTVYLPPGRWLHLWTTDVYGSEELGVWVNVQAPLGQPAVFFPEGSPVGEQFLTNLRTEGVIP